MCKLLKYLEKKLMELVMVTFRAETVTEFGFSVIRHPNYLQFNYEYIYTPEAEDILGN